MARRKTVWLRGYEWVPSLGQYRNVSNGRTVKRVAIQKKLDRSISQREDRLADGMTSFLDGDLDGSTWESRSHLLIKRQFLQSTALGAGGWAQMTNADRGKVGGRLRGEYGRLTATRQAIEAGEISPAQAMNRVRMTMGRARELGMETMQTRLPPPKRGMTRIQRRVLGAAEHCKNCVEYYKMGWQVAGTLPVPGARSVCDGNCRCSMLTKEVPTEDLEQWIGRASKGGPILAEQK